MGYSTNPNGSDFIIVTDVLLYGVFASAFNGTQYVGRDDISEIYCSAPTSIPVSASIPNSVIESDTFSPERFLSTMSQSIRDRM